MADQRVERERDLYLRLLNLGQQEDVEPFLREALALIVEVAGATQGYLELRDEQSDRRWWTAHAFGESEIETVRNVISRGIVGRAVATGETIVTPSALLDPRFNRRESVQNAEIQAVVCTPIGKDPPLGVLYLHGSPALPVDEVRTMTDLFARHVVPFADRLLARVRQTEDADPTRPFRESLRLEGIVGRTPAMASLLRQVALVAPLDVDVLLTGESGTGKSQIAHVIHDSSPRRQAPLVELNCATLPETLIESELFGALPGAHSTATRRVEGKVAAADGGTLVLDEVGELSPPAQAKLLQLLQSKEYFPLGSTKPVRADVRVVSATNADLRAAVGARRFREDLFYRLQVLPIRVPSLAERRDDVPELAAHFAARACERHRLPRLALSASAVATLKSCDWPGNVRQLAHAVQAAVIRAAGEKASAVEQVHLFPESPSDADRPAPATFQEATRRFQARLLRETLEDCGWSVTEAARRLDVARSHLYTLIHAFGLDRPR